MKLRSELIDTLATLGWDNKELSVEWRDYDNFNLENVGDKALRVGPPKQRVDNTKSGTRIVMFCAIDGAGIDRKVVDSFATGWEKQVFLWHAKATFALMQYRAQQLAVKAEREAHQRALEATKREYIQVPDDVAVDHVEQCVDLRIATAPTGVEPVVSFDYSRQPNRLWQDPVVRREKTQRLVAFLLTEGWIKTQ
jgi:hypothetical protein